MRNHHHNLTYGRKIPERLGRGLTIEVVQIVALIYPV
jgi:hypothetical protein